MQQAVSVQCPYCFECVTIWMAYDDVGEMIQDCEVCCRPWNMFVWVDEDGELRARISAA
jgi:hypothetical protein